MKDAPRLYARAMALHEAFVRGFTEERTVDAQSFASLLGIRVSGSPYALRMSEVAEIATRRRIVPVPTTDPALMGLVGVRGIVLPVYDLGVLLGQPACTSESPWLAILDGEERMALAFDAFDAHLRVPTNELHMNEGVTSHGAGAVRIDGVTRTIIDVSSVVGAIAQRERRRGDAKES